MVVLALAWKDGESGMGTMMSEGRGDWFGKVRGRRWLIILWSFGCCCGEVDGQRKGVV